jgi:hypothetical protein
MPSLHETIDDLVIGDDYDVPRTVILIPVGATLAKAWLTIKHAIDDPDSDAVLQKEITTAMQVGIGQITDDGAIDLEGMIVFQLTSTDTSLLQRDELYTYDIQVKTNTGKIYTVERGIFVPISEITLDTL